MPHPARPTRVFPADRVPAAGTPRSRHSGRHRGAHPGATVGGTDILRTHRFVRRIHVRSHAGRPALARRPPRRDHRGGAARRRRRSRHDQSPRRRRRRSGAASKGVFVVASAPRTVEQRCAVLCAAHPAGFVTGPTAGSARRPPPDAAELGVALLRAARRPPPEAARRALPADHRRCGRSIASSAVTASSSRRGLAWRSISPPTSGPSTTSRWSTSCSTSDASRPTSCRRSAVGSPIRLDRGSTTFRRTLAAARRVTAGRVPPGGRARRRAAPARRAGRAAGPRHPSVERRAGAHRPRRAGCPLGHRARHPPRAPHARRARRRRRAPAGDAPHGVADRDGHGGRHGAIRSASPTTSSASTASAGASCSVIRVRPEGRPRSSHSDGGKHSDGRKVGSDGGDFGVAAEDVGEGVHDLAEGGVLARRCRSAPASG